MISPLKEKNYIPTIYVWYIAIKYFFWLCLIAIFFSFSDTGNSVIFFLLIFFGIPIVIDLYLRIKYTYFFYDEHAITKNWGFIARQSKTISFDKIENIEIRQSLYERLFNIVRLEVWTGSPSQISISRGQSNNLASQIFILKKEDAEQLRDILLAKNIKPSERF